MGTPDSNGNPTFTGVTFTINVGGVMTQVRLDSKIGWGRHRFCLSLETILNLAAENGQRNKRLLDFCSPNGKECLKLLYYPLLFLSDYNPILESLLPLSL